MSTIEETDALLDRVVDALGGSPRRGQHAMADQVDAVLDVGGTVIIEAGTGTGKSLAYLVPALRAVAEGRGPVVVSTATLALQRQLTVRDLPAAAAALQGHLPVAPTYAVLKGWSNYACRNRLSGSVAQEPEVASLFDAVPGSDGAAGTHDGPGRSALAADVLRLREWAEVSETGDRDDLDPGVSDRAWRQVSVTKLACLGSTCPFIDDCFAQRARQTAGEADIVVTNHAMLGIAAAGNAGILPEHSAVIIDEAHELVARTTSAAAVELSMTMLTALTRAARRAGGSSIAVYDTAVEGLARVLAATEEGRIVTVAQDLGDALALVRDSARALASDLGSGGDKAADGTRKLAQASATEVFEIAERLVAASDRDVLWATRKTDDPTATLHAAPLDVAGQIKEAVLGVSAAVLTSATLAIGGGFEPMARSWGLFGAASQSAFSRDMPAVDHAHERWYATSVESPFDYSKQGIVYVAKHLPVPGRDGAAAAVFDEIAALMSASGGRTLGLFSSRRGAETAAHELRQRLDLPVLCQGDDQLPALVAAFTADEQTSLFGTLSMWQGVDVPGQTCQLVIIDRIPFPRPDDPVMSARSTLVAQRGGNGFMQVSATHAALLLAQGAGRLIRTVSDKGVVAILDPRLVTARYGSFLMRSLPPMWPTTDPQVAQAALRRLQVVG